MLLQCEKIKHNKEQCKAYAISQSNLCFWHNPEMEKKREAARKKGGQNRRKDYGELIIDYEMKNYKEIQQLLEIAVNKLLKGKCTTPEARTIGYLCNLARTIKTDAQWEMSDGF